jgi:hypothetical protein
LNWPLEVLVRRGKTGGHARHCTPGREEQRELGVMLAKRSQRRSWCTRSRSGLVERPTAG